MTRARRRSYTLRIVDATTVVAAMEIAAPAQGGKEWRVLCTVCALVAGVLVGRRAGGKCQRCPYSGPACLVVLL